MRSIRTRKRKNKKYFLDVRRFKWRIGFDFEIDEAIVN
jgi:hypothetical protein